MEIFECKTDIGLIRETNEDATLVLNHPKNKNIKLMLVADGMGGKEYGEIAANYVASALSKWFSNKDIKTLNDIEKTEDLIKRYIKVLNTNLIRSYGEDILGTTLSLAIITKKKTLVVNVGDSRTYIYQKNKLIQITEDDSDVWLYHKFAGVKKDDLRYFVNNNVISACIGICQELCKVSTYIIDNDYDLILSLTDGVTDIITDKKINSLIKKYKNNSLLDKIINEAVNVEQNLKVPIYLKRKKLSRYIVPFKGRDNASGAIYMKDNA